MFIKTKDLELRKIVFDESIPPGELDLGQEIQQKDLLKTSGHAELIRENRGAHEVVEDIRLVGSFSTRVEVRCARCLDPVGHAIEENFDLLYRPQGVDAMGDEASISQADTEIGYYHGPGLLLEDVLKEQILLALPVREICSSECKGLCPQCGANLNLESCDCSGTMRDPRWAALEDIRKKLDR